MQSRYYDPTIRRFINSDDLELLPTLAGTIGQLNLYAYCNNNPVMNADPRGYALDTILDIGFLIWGMIDFINEPTWENFGWLALDIIFTALPFIPGIGKASKVITKMDNLSDISKFTGSADDIILLGQSMKTRIIPEAVNLGVDYYHGLSKYDDLARISRGFANTVGYFHNMGFIAGKSLQGVRFIDMGFDIARIGEKGLNLSKFTIYSERFIAQTFRWKNIFRLGYSLI